MENGILDDQFMQQFGGSASANLVFVVGFFVMAACKKLCSRKSRCHSKFHSCCLDVDIADGTVRGNNPTSDDPEEV